MIKRVKELVEEPPAVLLNNDETKCVCVIEAKVGQQEIAVLCDTGAGKSLIREDVADFLVKSETTKNHCSALTALSRPLNCEGAEKGRVIGTISRFLMVRFSFEEHEEWSAEEATVAFNPALRDLRTSERKADFHSKVLCHEEPLRSGDPGDTRVEESRCVSRTPR